LYIILQADVSDPGINCSRLITSVSTGIHLLLSGIWDSMNTVSTITENVKSTDPDKLPDCGNSLWLQPIPKSVKCKYRHIRLSVALTVSIIVVTKTTTKDLLSGKVA